MKKTLLGLALATLATAALADVSIINTSTSYGQGSISANGSISSKFGFNTLKTTDTYSPLTKDSVKKQVVTTNSLNNTIGTDFGFAGSFVTAFDTTVAGDISWTHSYKFARTDSLNTKKTFVIDGKEKVATKKTPKDELEWNGSFDGFHLDSWQLQATVPSYGTVSFGNETTAAGTSNAIGIKGGLGSLGTLDHYNVFSGIDGVVNASDDNKLFYVDYQLPTLVDNLDASLSVGHYTGTKAWEFAGLASYNICDTLLEGSYAFSFYKNDFNNKVNQHSFELTANNSSLVDGLSLTADLAFTYHRDSSQNASKKDVTTAKDYQFSGALAAEYTINQYLKPYLGVAYTFDNSQTFGDDASGKTKDKVVVEKTITNTFAGYAGISSDVYSYGYLNVNVFGAVGFAYVKPQPYNLDKDYKLVKNDSDKSSTVDLGIKAGLKVSF